MSECTYEHHRSNLVVRCAHFEEKAIEVLAQAGYTCVLGHINLPDDEEWGFLYGLEIPVTHPFCNLGAEWVFGPYPLKESWEGAENWLMNWEPGKLYSPYRP